MTFAPHDVLPRVLRPSALRRRVGMLLHRSATLAELADGLAELHGDSLLVTESHANGRDRTLTYAQAAKLVRQWSAAVVARSEPGQPVVVATPNCYDQLLVCLAVARAGRLPAPVNQQMSSAEVDHVVADSGAALVVRDVAELRTGPGSRARPPAAARPHGARSSPPPPRPRRRRRFGRCQPASRAP